MLEARKSEEDHLNASKHYEENMKALEMTRVKLNSERKKIEWNVMNDLAAVIGRAEREAATAADHSIRKTAAELQSFVVR